MSVFNDIVKDIALHGSTHSEQVAHAKKAWVARFAAARKERLRAFCSDTMIGISPSDIELISNDALNSAAASHARRWVEAVRNPADSCPRTLLLLGGVGTGKTLAAAWAAMALSDPSCPEDDNGYLRWFLQSSGNTAQRRGRNGVRASRLAHAMNPWADDGPRLELMSPVFVLDDLGTEREDDKRFGESLIEFLDARLSSGGATVITSNLKPESLRERYDARALDRLRAMALVVTIGGESLRKSTTGFNPLR